MRYLNNEHGNWWYLHVMAELEIIEKRDCLGHAYISIGLEADIGYWSSWQYNTHQVLCDNIEPWGLAEEEDEKSR